jgi:hypothetical protein
LPEARWSLHEILHHEGLLAALGVASVVMFVLSVVGVPFFLARLPADYLSRRDQDGLGGATPRSPWRMPLRIAKNALGAVFVLLGVLMLVLPGQGLLTLVVGLLLVDFPGKRRFMRHILGGPRVLRLVNTLRKRWNQPPLEI